jgi:hypothetical protein
MVDLFAENITKWSGEQPHDSVRLRLATRASGQPTDQLVSRVAARNFFRFGQFHSSALRRFLTRASGKVIAQIPQIGGFFFMQQIRHSAAWPALQFLQHNVRSLCAGVLRCVISSCFVVSESGFGHDSRVSVSSGLSFHPECGYNSTARFVCLF